MKGLHYGRYLILVNVPMKLLRRWTQLRRAGLILTGVTVGGVGTLFAAFRLTSAPATEWLSGLLVNIGASILLVVPLYLLNRRLDDRIESVRAETKSRVEALTDQVSSFEHEVERRLEEVAASVSAQLAAEHARDLEAFDALRKSPTYRTVHEALRRASDLGLIAQKRGPRVRVSESWGVFVRVDFKPTFSVAEIGFTIEDSLGDKLDEVAWQPQQSLEDVMVRVGRAVQRATSGDDFNVEDYFDGLREALTVAHSHPDRRPVFQLCPPQWVLTDTSLVHYGDRRAPYVVSVARLRHDQHLSNHVREKPWVDPDSFDEAYLAGMALVEEPPPF